MHIQENVSLAKLTTLGVGGRAHWFARARSEAEICEALEWAREQQVRLFVIGGGSNLLVSDDTFDGLVLKMEIAGVQREFMGDLAHYAAGAGESWDTLVAASVTHGDAGMECLSGIPGTVGGTPVQNVGAYGQETAQTVTCVRAIDIRSGAVSEFGREDCGFAYRTSRFNGVDRDRYILTRVDYRLRTGAPAAVKYADLQGWFAARGIAQPSLEQVREAVLAIRLSKGMVVDPPHADMHSAGSFFKNPTVPEKEAAALAARNPGVKVPVFAVGSGVSKLSAAWLVEHAGFHKGYAMGAAGISSRHSLALVNLGGASCADILRLRDAVVAGVRDKFGVTLQMEPVLFTGLCGLVPPL